MKRRLRSRAEYPFASMPEDARNRLSEKSFGVRKAQRVRFNEPGMDGVTVHVSGRGYQETKQPGNENPTADAPKTSEYAYFRNVRNGAVHGHHQPLHKGERRLDSSKNGYCCRDSVGASDTHKPSTKELSFSFLKEKEGPSDHCYLLRSPLVYECCKSELGKKTEKSSMSHFENVTPVGQCSSPSALPYMSLNTEDNCAEK